MHTFINLVNSVLFFVCHNFFCHLKLDLRLETKLTSLLNFSKSQRQEESKWMLSTSIQQMKNGYFPCNTFSYQKLLSLNDPYINWNNLRPPKIKMKKINLKSWLTIVLLKLYTMSEFTSSKSIMKTPKHQLLKKSFMENFSFCAVNCVKSVQSLQ